MRSKRARLIAAIVTVITFSVFPMGYQAIAANTGTVDQTAQITIRNTNAKPAGDWQVGDVMQFQVSMVNVSSYRFSAKVRETNIENGLAACVSDPNGWGNFKSIWEEQTAVSCNGSHVVTSADIEAGAFTPYVDFDKYAGCQDQTYSDDGQCREPHWKGEKTELERFTADPIEIYPQYISAQMTASVEADKDYQVGDKVPVTVTMTVLEAGEARSIVGPADSQNGEQNTNLTIPADARPCSFGDISTAEPGAVKTCETMTYSITADDLARGSIQPFIEIDVVDDTSGNGKILQRVTAETFARVAHTWPASVSKQNEYDADVNLLASVDRTYTNNEHGSLTTNDPDSGAYYRIPALAVASNGDLLAAYDYRPNMPADSPNPNSIVQRRSTDNGKTWGPETIVAGGEEGTQKVGYSDPSYVIDRESGTIFLFHVKSFDAGFSAGKVIKENGVVDENDRSKPQLAVSKSTDNGYTWSTEVISADVLDTNEHIDGFGFATSGAGIQIQHGAHAGRLVQQYAFSDQLDEGTWRNVGVSVYSDDGGQTWQAGTPTPVVTSANQQVAFDENKVVELSDGTLLLNSRTSYQEGKNYRLTTKSFDGGITWETPAIEKQLVDPGNNASIIRPFPNARPGTPKSKVLLFSNAKNDEHRVHGTNRINGSVTVSYNDGQTWDNDESWRFTDENEYVGYSTMAVQSDGRVGLLHETAGGGIQYLSFSLAQALPTSKLNDLKLTASGSYESVAVTTNEAFASAAPAIATHAGALITYRSDSLPEGLALDSSTGVVLGKLAHDGDVSVKVVAKITDGVEYIELPLTLAVSVSAESTQHSGVVDAPQGDVHDAEPPAQESLDGSEELSDEQSDAAHPNSAERNINSPESLATTGAELPALFGGTALLLVVGMTLLRIRRARM